jgi:hypothetical protein
MSDQDNDPRREGARDSYDNQSVAGEEDPGAAGDLMTRGATSRRENEGGGDGNQAAAKAAPEQGRTQVDLTNAELVQLQLRVIALENLVTALLAGAPGETADLARAMAAYISPRPGSTPHHLTIQAAAQMVHLVERAKLFQEHPHPSGQGSTSALGS